MPAHSRALIKGLVSVVMVVILSAYLWPTEGRVALEWNTVNVAARGDSHIRPAVLRVGRVGPARLNDNLLAAPARIDVLGAAALASRLLDPVVRDRALDLFRIFAGPAVGVILFQGISRLLGLVGLTAFVVHLAD